MKQIYRKNSKIIILICIGVVLTALSFIYEYAISFSNPIITYSLIVIDVVLLVVNCFYLSYILNGNIRKSLINSIICSLLFFVFISGVVLCLVEDKASLDLLINILKVLVYLSPSIIILLPIVYVICLILG